MGYAWCQFLAYSVYSITTHRVSRWKIFSEHYSFILFFDTKLDWHKHICSQTKPQCCQSRHFRRTCSVRIQIHLVIWAVAGVIARAPQSPCFIAPSWICWHASFYHSWLQSIKYTVCNIGSHILKFLRLIALAKGNKRSNNVQGKYMAEGWRCSVFPPPCDFVGERAVYNSRKITPQNERVILWKKG